ncbi:hypothetical protein M3Y97_01146400 [Aphelenchoides bicaudatus]|nr:hypothetical protein M3Y97_01146400 [Aphelenchoides bicaudatus]
MTDLTIADEDSSPKSDKVSLFDRLFNDTSSAQAPPTSSGFIDTPFGLSMNQFPSGFDPSLFMFSTVPQITNGAQVLAQRNSSKTLKCPKCNWHYKYQETLEIHMKEKHSDSEVTCVYCLQNQPHPKLARGETYKCGFKPYRCDLCKYSTTTKGNLSIHMQSDKHLHAMQEQPQVIPTQPQMPPSGEIVNDQVLQCMICSTFSTDSVAQMVDHLETDRSRPCAGDIIMLNGYFHCHLCPYNTNLKANFQLHTRTDKHLQRVQLINHMREQCTALAPAAAMCRLSTVKSLVQVRCRPCQEILTCVASVREHCESRQHLSRCIYLSAVSAQKPRASAHTFGEIPLNMSALNASSVRYECKQCPFAGTSIAEAQAHKSTHEEVSDSGKDEGQQQKNGEPLDFSLTSKQTATDLLSNAEHLIAMKEVAFYCKQCDFLSNTLEGLQNHEKAGDHSTRDPSTYQDEPATTNDEQCPLCIKSVPTLRQHLLEEHNIVDEVAQKLMTTVSATTNSVGSSASKSVYRHRCPRCPLIFKQNEEMVTHQLTHDFRLKQQCSNCSQSFQSVSQLLQHQQNEHKEELRCELCSISFTDRSAMAIHMSSLEHLQKAKRHLEEQPQEAMKLNEKVLQLLQANSSNAQNRLYKCNVCLQNYNLGSTLDTHLRSVGHQTRMNRLNELVESGEIDAQKPVSEQPNGVQQKLIAELVDGDKAASNEQMTNENPLLLNMINMANFIQMAQNPATSSSDAINAFSQLNNDSGIDFASLFDEKLSRPRKRKLGTEFRRSLEGYGFELVSQFVENVQKDKIDYLPDEKVAELKEQFSSINRDSVPVEAIQAFAENLQNAINLVPDDLIKNENDIEDSEEIDSPPEPKRPRSESNKSSTASTPRLNAAGDLNQQLMATMMGLPMMNNGNGNAQNNPFMNSEMFQAAFASMIPGALQMGSGDAGDSSLNGSSPQKRSRTRITDDQLKVLRQYFDINNSPTEQQIKEMSIKTSLTEKVIKHWYRNNLFKERQRDKNSPYNFNVPAKMRIDLDTYEKTGEAKIIQLKDEKDSADPKPTSSLVIDPDICDNRGTSPSNSSTHSSSAATNTNQMSSAADLMSTFNKAVAAATGMSMFNNNAEFTQNPFAAFFGSNNDEGTNVFANLLNGFTSSSTPNSLSTPATPNTKSMSSVGSAAATMTSSGSSRRANRTRFTDFQLRTLQDFFDKQAYPKDDDLEMLSKKLSLSPRVIVVWFQNARQKARKVYENQPNQDNERFIRTPGCNFQCKRCSLVFQRFGELIQHQQKLCYRGDLSAQQNDNQSLEEHLDEEERSQHLQQKSIDGLKMPDDEVTCDDQAGDSSNADNNNTTHNFLKLFTESKTSGDALMKMFKNRASPTKSKFSKRCPVCSLLFNSRDKLSEHLASNHSDNPLALTVDVDNLPSEPESGTLSSTEELLGKISALTGGSPLDLSALAGTHNDFQQLASNDRTISTPGSQQSNEDMDNCLDDYSSTGSFNLRALSTSPHAILSAFGSPLSALNGLSSGGQMSFAQASQLQRSPAASSGNKRYRTHLTPLQVFVMKSLFADYKTPSMTECDILGREIQLHKRVVQVWFQNARAKQRKCGPGSIVTVEEGLCTTNSSGCEFCGVEFNGRTTVQDHIFTNGHINQVKERGALIRGNGTEETMENRPARNQSTASGRQRSDDDSSGITPDDMSFNPLNLVYNLMDPNVIGTPITMLQIPEAVMTQISHALQTGKPCTKFTQDGMEFNELAGKVGDEDFKCARQTESEVGWACPQCSNVFQKESFLKNHQKFICTGCDGVFLLVQKHYECLPCEDKFGTQDDFKKHCEQSGHKSKRLMRLPPQLFPA